MSVEQQFSVRTCESFSDADAAEAALLPGMLAEAERWLCTNRWCNDVRARYFGLGVGGVVAVFLFEIDNLASPEDALLWVIVGDIPPAYLVTDEARTPKRALARYIELMREWVEAASSGRPVGKLIPVNAPATPANARLLSQRLDFLQREFVQDGRG